MNLENEYISECFCYEDDMPTIVYLDTLPAQNGLDILHFNPG